MDQPQETEPDREPEPNTTVDLVHRAQDGDDHALSSLFARYYPRVRRVVRRRLGRGLRQHIESVDIVQETFLQARKDFPRFEMRRRSSLINYLSRIAERKILEALRKIERAGPALPLDATQGSQDSGIQVPSPVETPSQDSIKEEAAGALRACLQELSPEHREVIVLRYFFHLKHEDIAEAQGRPSADAARMFLKSAMVELRQRLVMRGLASD